MSLSNLPPGITTSMIPGNSPQDELWEKLMDWVVDQLAESGLSHEQVYSGIKTLIALHKEDVSEVIHDEMIRTLYDV